MPCRVQLAPRGRDRAGPRGDSRPGRDTVHRLRRGSRRSSSSPCTPRCASTSAAFTRASTTCCWPTATSRTGHRLMDTFTTWLTPAPRPRRVRLLRVDIRSIRESVTDPVPQTEKRHTLSRTRKNLKLAERAADRGTAGERKHAGQTGRQRSDPDAVQGRVPRTAPVNAQNSTAPPCAVRTGSSADAADRPPTAGSVQGGPPSLAHLLELWKALADAYAATGRAVPGWTNVLPATASPSIRAAHVMELRAAGVRWSQPALPCSRRPRHLRLVGAAAAAGSSCRCAVLAAGETRRPSRESRIRSRRLVTERVLPGSRCGAFRCAFGSTPPSPNESSGTT